MVVVARGIGTVFEDAKYNKFLIQMTERAGYISIQSLSKSKNVTNLIPENLLRAYFKQLFAKKILNMPIQSMFKQRENNKS